MSRVSCLSFCLFMLICAAAVPVQAAYVPMVYNETTGMDLLDWNMEGDGSPFVGWVGLSAGGDSTIEIVNASSEGISPYYSGTNILKSVRMPGDGSIAYLNFGSETAVGDIITTSFAFQLKDPNSYLAIYPGTNGSSEESMGAFGFFGTGAVEYHNNGWQDSGLTNNIGAWNEVTMTHTNGTGDWDLSVNGSSMSFTMTDTANWPDCISGNLRGLEFYNANDVTSTVYIDADGSNGVRTAPDSGLHITEIYSGTTPKTPGVAGTFDTSEWFEVTNFGDTAVDLVANPIYYDDDSANPTKDTQLLGVNSIAPGESVVFLVDWESDMDTVEGEEEKLALAYDLFAEAWGELAGVQVGYCTGNAGGLSTRADTTSADTIYLFDGNLATSSIIDMAGYSTTEAVLTGTFVSQSDGIWNGMAGNPGFNDIAGVDVSGWEAEVQFGSDEAGWITLSGSPGALQANIPGDANRDGKVDGSDVTILAGNWQYGVTGGGATWGMGDFNGDGKVDGSDVTILAGNWQYGVAAAAASVPEPGIIVLLIMAATSLFIIRQR